jgi:hypothetical protein
MISSMTSRSPLRGLKRGEVKDTISGQPEQTLKTKKRDVLLAQVSEDNHKLRDAINEFYRETAKHGDGGTADYIRQFGDAGHIQKATDRLKQLQDVIMNPKTNEVDYEIAVDLYQTWWKPYCKME